MEVITSSRETFSVCSSQTACHQSLTKLMTLVSETELCLSTLTKLTELGLTWKKFAKSSRSWMRLTKTFKTWKIKCLTDVYNITNPILILITFEILINITNNISYIGV